MRRRALATCAAVAAIGLSTTSASAQTAGCSWPLKGNNDTLNIAFPDESATYWAAELPPVPVIEAKITGQYPYARYFSFHVYDAAARPVGHLADYQLAPDTGSGNPFSDPTASAGGIYTGYIQFSDPPAHPAPNTIYAGTGKSDGFLIYRVYVPNDPASEQGSVPLPTITLQLADGSSELLTLGQCEALPPSAGGQVNDALNSTQYPAGAPAPAPFPTATNPPTFIRAGGVGGKTVPQNPVTGDNSNSSFFANLDNAYLKVTLSRQFGDVVAMRFRAPTFPDTRAGQPPTTPSDMRYWSVCMNEFATTRYTKCSADYQTLVGPDGFARFVIADPGDRPANATAANGINYLGWPGAYYDGFVLYRSMVPNPDFASSVWAVAPNATLTNQMGDYGPVAVYCSRAQIETKGFDSCFGG
jgi:hypothetical protein